MADECFFQTVPPKARAFPFCALLLLRFSSTERPKTKAQAARTTPEERLPDTEKKEVIIVARNLPKKGTETRPLGTLPL